MICKTKVGNTFCIFTLLVSTGNSLTYKHLHVTMPEDSFEPSISSWSRWRYRACSDCKTKPRNDLQTSSSMHRFKAPPPSWSFFFTGCFSWYIHLNYPLLCTGLSIPSIWGIRTLGFILSALVWCAVPARSVPVKHFIHICMHSNTKHFRKYILLGFARRCSCRV